MKQASKLILLVICSFVAMLSCKKGNESALNLSTPSSPSNNRATSEEEYDFYETVLDQQLENPYTTEKMHEAFF